MTPLRSPLPLVILLGAFTPTGCNADAAPEAVVSRPEPKPAFGLDLPKGSVPLELRGVGSEFLRAPAGAHVERLGEGDLLVDAGEDFRLEVHMEAPPLAVLVAGLPKQAVALRTDDAVLVRQGDGFAFAVVRELVPEWDETDRRHLSCSSPGLLEGSATQTTSKRAASAMVAACRTLSLPTLD